MQNMGAACVCGINNLQQFVFIYLGLLTVDKIHIPAPAFCIYWNSVTLFYTYTHQAINKYYTLTSMPIHTEVPCHNVVFIYVASTVKRRLKGGHKNSPGLFGPPF